ncbi:hypothetical protein SPHINGOT1_460017 [Sphingomonas sp. T1]|nr:hypothetical protein SPHINGOT1_460017 [Sphingomonas sp. T1]
MAVDSNFGWSNRYYVVIEAFEFESIKVNEIAWYMKANHLPLPSMFACRTADKTFGHQHTRTNGLTPPN